MNNEPPTNTNQAMPAWFADTANSTPPIRHRSTSKKRLPIILGLVVICAIIGAIVWFVIAANNAKTEAYLRFQDTYVRLETNLVGFDDITEPDNFDATQLKTDWTDYTSALEVLTQTSLYKDNEQLIESISTSSLAYETYVNDVLPMLILYLAQCYGQGDSTMYNATCRGYIQTAVDSGDPLTEENTRTLLSVINQMSQTNSLTESQTDSIQALQEKLFAVSVTIQDTVRPKLIELGKKVNITMSAADGQ